ncbi:MAG TPA: glycosyltransferase [Chitinophagaceae bacterium]|nr:glycosyltransferase [Chitinophagaceae bacterium]
MARIIFTVTNDLTYDQRMQRICTSLASQGFDIVLTGRRLTSSVALESKMFKQKRLHCLFNKSIVFYAEYNLRLFFWLLFQKADVLCAIDLDTILPVLAVSYLRRKKRVYDAHELFTEQVEIISRPRIYRAWLRIEKFSVPRFNNGYTVNQFIAGEFFRRYNVQYEVIRNLPVFTYEPGPASPCKERIIIYQGAVNKGRCFETLIPAMQQVNAKLVICGNGNFFEEVKQLIQQYNVQNKVVLKGYVLPGDLKKITPTACIAVTLFEHTGLNQYYSLGNRFFDYIMAGVPQVCVAYPEYKAINDIYNVAFLINDTNTETIAWALNQLLNNNELHETLSQNCRKARLTLQWQEEEKKLVAFYNKFANQQNQHR